MSCKSSSCILGKQVGYHLTEALNIHSYVAVIDRADNNGTITPDKWRKVETKLNTVFLDILREYLDSGPRFHDGGWFQGHVKLIVCTDQPSVDHYKLAISRIEEA